MSSAEPPLLSDFGHRSYVSQSGLAGVLKIIRDRGMPTSTSRRSVKRSRENAARLQTIHGPLIKSFTCNGKVIEYVDPPALLAHTCASCEGFSNFMLQKLDNHASDISQPWGLIIYMDEVSPGNQLRHDNKRKMHAVYYSFVQFGADGLSNESCWMILTVIRSSLTKDMGGVVNLFPHILSCFFENNDMRTGVLLNFPGQSRMFCCNLQIIVADESALKSIWENKGAGGTLPCLLCSNVVLSRHDLHTHDANSHLVSMTETDVSRFAKHDSRSIQAIVNHLSANHPILDPTPFGKLESALGFNYCPGGTLWSKWFPEVASPTDCVMFDWMHTYCVHGIWNIEVGYLLKVLSKIRVTHSTLNEWMQNVHWPHHISSRAVSGKTAFEKRSGNISAPMACSASEALGLYSPIRFFLMTHVTTVPHQSTDVVAACQSYFLLAEVLDHLKAVARGKSSPAALEAAILAHYRTCQAVYGIEIAVPKHHYAVHLPEQYARHGVLLSCFVQERKHRELKRFGNHLTNTSSKFESGLLESTLLCHLSILEDESELYSGPVLVDACLAPKELADIVQSTFGVAGPVMYSLEAVVQTSQRCHADDVLLFEVDGDRRVGQVWYHTSSQHVGFTCVALWEALGNNKFRSTESPVLIPMDCSLENCIWYVSNDEHFVIPTSV